MVSALDSAGSVRALTRADCVVFLGKTLNSVILPLSTQVYQNTRQTNLACTSNIFYPPHELLMVTI